MTNREWIETTLLHRETGRIPYNFMFSPPIEAMLEEHFQSDNLEETLKFPIRIRAPETIKPLFANPELYGDTIEDEFGVVWSTSYIDRGAPIGPCLHESSLSGYTFPDPSEQYRFEGLKDWSDSNRDHYRIIFVGDLWERATFMRGMEDLLVDVTGDTSFVAALLGGICDYIIGTMEILIRLCGFEAIALSDDYGTQKDMIISPAMWRRLVKPHLGTIYTYGKKHGKAIFHHSCGNVSAIVPDLIDLGLDILHPIQPEAMDIYALKRMYGRDLTFCGGLGTQVTLPHKDPNNVRDEVETLKEVMGRGGGFILEPGITLQADVPLPNLVAMIETAML
jgi:uroporphyrinogen decarboxylase